MLTLVIDSNHLVTTDGRSCRLEGRNEKGGDADSLLTIGNLHSVAPFLLTLGLVTNEGAQRYPEALARSTMAARLIRDRLDPMKVRNRADESAVIPFGRGRFGIAKRRWHDFVLVNPTKDISCRLEELNRTAVAFHASIDQCCEKALERTAYHDLGTVPYWQLNGLLDDLAAELFDDAENGGPPLAPGRAAVALGAV